MGAEDFTKLMGERQYECKHTECKKYHTRDCHPLRCMDFVIVEGGFTMSPAGKFTPGKKDKP